MSEGLKIKKNYNRRYAKDYGFLRSIFYLVFMHLVVDNVFKYFYELEIYGTENIPKECKNLIYASNHVSTLDPPLVTHVTRKKIAYLAKSELFEKGDKFAWFVKRLGAVAVNRTKPELATFKTIRDVFTTDWSLGVFPQGGIFPYGENLVAKKGFAVIAKSISSDIIPIAISEFSGYPKGLQFKKQKIKIYIGKPISYKMREDEIIGEWKKFISNHANYND